MAHLKLKLFGQIIKEIELHSGQDYLAGRSDDVAIPLPPHKGISRHHLKIYQENETWMVAHISKFGQIICNGESLQVLTLNANKNFSVPPFEFEFTLSSNHENDVSADTKALVQLTPHLNVEPHFAVQKVQGLLKQESQPLENQSPIVEGNDEATAIYTSSPLVAYIKVLHLESEQILDIELKGLQWFGGRDVSCDIPVTGPKASRKHFEIRKSEDHYQIIDLHSSNGTFVNGDHIRPGKPITLKSGDLIEVSGMELTFELRNPKLQNQLALIQGTDQQGAQSLLNNTMSSNPQGISNLGVEKLNTEEMKQLGYFEARWSPIKSYLQDKKSRPKIIAAIIVILFAFILSDEDNEQKTNSVGAASSSKQEGSVSLDQLNPESRQAIKNSFNLAMNMYMQTRYELCIAELKKLHDTIPAYENSRELLTFCEHGAELVKKKEDSDRREREKENSEREIAQIVESCKSLVSNRKALSEVQVCLSRAIERAPEHPLVLGLLEQAQIQAHEQMNRSIAAENSKKRRASGERLYQKGLKSLSLGQYNVATNELSKALDLFEPSSERYQQIRSKLSEAKKLNGQKTTQALSNCKENIAKSLFKLAAQECELVLKNDPQNQEAKNLKSQALSELRRELKSIYEDSVLEESMGNTDSAKEKWKQIKERSFPQEEYYKKSIKNLQKYGGS